MRVLKAAGLRFAGGERRFCQAREADRSGGSEVVFSQLQPRGESVPTDSRCVDAIAVPISQLHAQEPEGAAGGWGRGALFVHVLQRGHGRFFPSWEPALRVVEQLHHGAVRVRKVVSGESGERPHKRFIAWPT